MPCAYAQKRATERTSSEQQVTQSWNEMLQRYFYDIALRLQKPSLSLTYIWVSFVFCYFTHFFFLSLRILSCRTPLFDCRLSKPAPFSCKTSVLVAARQDFVNSNSRNLENQRENRWCVEKSFFRSFDWMIELRLIVMDQLKFPKIYWSLSN